MKTFSLVVALFFALPLGGADSPSRPENLCEPVAPRRYPTQARAIGITVDEDWVEKHIEAIHKSFEAGCERFSGCVAVWGNPVQFCRLLLTVDLRAQCEETWDIDSDLRGWQQCRAIADVYSLNQIAPAQRVWRGIQQAAAEKAPAKVIGSPIAKIDPAAPPLRTAVDVVVRAFDPETGFPMYGLVLVEGTSVGPTFQPFHYTLRFKRVTDDLGRISFRSPAVVVRSSPARDSGFPGYSEITLAFSTPVPTVRLVFDPPVETWREGENVVRVTAFDDESGEVVAGKILRPGLVGDDPDRVTITLHKSGEGLCGDPVWFRTLLMDHPDASLPISPCR